MPWRAGALSVFAVLAGERSGDQLGAAVVRQLDARFVGITGPALRQAGCESIGSVDELSLVGISEIVGELPRLARRMAQLEREITALRPTAVLSIDSPSFNLRLAPRLRRQGIPVVHWVAPQVWAWRPGRAARIAASVDALACLFPFEPGLFGPKARFTGHPAGTAPISARPEAVGIAAGSRPHERRRLGPVFAAAAAQLGLPIVEAVPPGLHPVCPGARQVPSAAAMAQQVRVALVCAGTATLELGVAGVPMVVAYQTSPISYRLGRRLLRVGSIALPNLLLGRALVPEQVQQLDPTALARDAASLLGSRGDPVSAALLELRALLSAPTAISAVAQLLDSYRTSSHFAASTKSL